MSEDKKVEPPKEEVKKEEEKKEEKKEEITLAKAFEKLILQAKNKDTVCKGLHEVCKAIDHKNAKLVLLAKDCDEPKYKQLISALCKSSMVPVYEVETREELGLWLGLCKFDKMKEARKIRKCSVACIKDFGENTEYTAYIYDALKLAPKEVKA